MSGGLPPPPPPPPGGEGGGGRMCEFRIDRYITALGLDVTEQLIRLAGQNVGRKRVETATDG